MYSIAMRRSSEVIIDRAGVIVQENAEKSEVFHCNKKKFRGHHRQNGCGIPNRQTKIKVKFSIATRRSLEDIIDRTGVTFLTNKGKRHVFHCNNEKFRGHHYHDGCNSPNKH